MFQKLEDVEKRYDELTTKISDPEVISRTQEWQKLMKEHAGLEDVVTKYREYKKAKSDFEEAKAMASDKELKELAEAEKILMMIKTQSVKLEQVLEGKRLLYLQELYLECIQCMQRQNIGKLRF